jgi:hypothetical protein
MGACVEGVAVPHAASSSATLPVNVRMRLAQRGAALRVSIDPEAINPAWDVVG